MKFIKIQTPDWELSPKKGVNNTANTKESKDGQTWRRLKRIEIAFFIAC